MKPKKPSKAAATLGGTPMYDSHQLVISTDPTTGQRRFSNTLIASLTGKSRKTIGRMPFSAETAEAIVAAMPLLHKEVPVFSYASRVFPTLTTLRDLEEEARARLNALEDDASPEQIADAFELAIEKVAGPSYEMIAAAHAIRCAADSRKLSQEEMTTAYLAASVLFTMALLWEKAADKMFKATDREPLDFLSLGIDHVGTAIGALCFANELYGIVQQELIELSKLYQAVNSRNVAPEGMERELQIAEILRGKLAQQDSEIAALNMVAIGSHARDWKRAGPGYLALTGYQFEEVEPSLDLCEANLGTGLPLAVRLLKRMPDNARLARNLAYFSIQGSNLATLEIAATHLRRDPELAGDKLWTEKILQREPLLSEPHLKDLFVGGKPAIWKE